MSLAGMNTAYRYRYNGKESMGLLGGRYDYGFRMYDAALGRFLSVDPLTKGYPWYTPYQFAGNKPIVAIDLDGLEEYIAQYKLSNGKATMIEMLDNKKLAFDLKGMTILNKTTGKPMGKLEIGTIQYQYFGDDGKRLAIRRNREGNYVPGDNEAMSNYTGNLFGSVYIGADNPTYKDSRAGLRPDYRREPQDEVDEAAMWHDMDYDDKQAGGATDAFLEPKVKKADAELTFSTALTGAKYVLGENDSKTGKKVSEKTARRAVAVETFGFSILTIKNKVQTKK